MLLTIVIAVIFVAVIFFIANERAKSKIEKEVQDEQVFFFPEDESIAGALPESIEPVQEPVIEQPQPEPVKEEKPIAKMQATKKPQTKKKTTKKNTGK